MTDPVPSNVCPVCETPDGDHLDWCTPQAREQPPSKEWMDRWAALQLANESTQGIAASTLVCELVAENERLKHQVGELSVHAEKWVKRALGGTCLGGCGTATPSNDALCSACFLKARAEQRAAPEPEPTHFAFLIKRPRDKEAWPTIFTSRARAIEYPDRASPVVPVCLTQPPGDGG